MKNILFIVALLCTFNLNAQTIKSAKGYSNDIGNLVSMMTDIKARVIRTLPNLTIEQTDFLLDENANSIGAMIFHLAAVEKYYQLFTFENRDFTKEEYAYWGAALDLGEVTRESIKGKPISHYLQIWDEVRVESFRLLKTKDDKWLKSNVKNSSMNNHWAWYHVMEHQANHMGQIRLIEKRAK